MPTADRDHAYLAHDLSQLLWAIQGRARALASRLEGPDAATAAVIAEDAATAAAMLAERSGVADTATADPVAVTAQAWRQSLDQARALRSSPAAYRWQGLDEAPTVAISTVALRRILGNLLANAIEAQPQGGGVSCTATVAERYLHLTIADEGPGIAPSLHPTLFAAGTTQHDTPGRGLGLAGARTLARACGGDLALAATDRGARFVLTLPLATGAVVGETTAGAAGGDAATSDRVATGLQLLVVDDEPAVRDMLAELLGAEGHAPSLRADADSALAQFAGGRYDAALIDLGLSGRSGGDLAAALRERDPALALILVTGWGREQELAACAPGLADFTAIKPLDLPQLRQLLVRAAGLTATRRRARAREA